MNFLNKLKKEKETDAEKVKPMPEENLYLFKVRLSLEKQ